MGCEVSGCCGLSVEDEFENFRLVFDRMFMGTVIGRMDDNEAIFKRVLDDPEFQKTLMDLYALRVYQRLREPTEDS